MSAAVRAGYKMTEVGVIPKDWEASTIGDNSKWMSGGTPRRTNTEFWRGDIPWISGSTLKLAEISTSDQFLTKEAVSIGSKMAPVESTLLLVRGSALHNEIRAGLVIAPVSFNQDVKALIPYETVEPKFLTYYILGQSDALLKLVSSAGNSAGVLDTKLVQGFKFFKPPIVEQRAIAAALSDVDALLAKHGQLIAKKQGLKQAAMQQLLTGQTRLPGFSGGWEVKKLGDVCNLLKGSGLSKNSINASGLRKCILYGELFTTYGQVIQDVVSRTSSSEGRMSEAGDVLIPGSTTTDGIDLAIASALLESGVALGGDINIVRCDIKSGFIPQFLANYLTQIKKREIAERAQGTTIVHLYGRDLRDLTVHRPAIAEQTAVAAILSDMDTEIAALEERQTKTRALKQGMMQELLTGRTRLV
jgi:type I restriction enzyme, S subunit